MLSTIAILKKQRILISLIFIICILFAHRPSLFSPGIEDLEPMQPFLNGAFAESAQNQTFEIVPAFSALKFDWALTFAEHPTKDTLFIGQRNGIIFYIDDNEAATVKRTFLNLQDSVGFIAEAGLLGMALHPNFGQANAPGRNYFYLLYSTKDSNGDNLPASGTGVFCLDDQYSYFGNYLKLVRYEVIENTVEVNTNVPELVMMKTRMYNGAHRGGTLEFGADGYLYISLGDQGQFTTSQDLATNFDGGILRIDVDMDPSKSHAPLRVHPQDPRGPDEISGVGYFIPNDNPFTNLGGTVFEEYYAFGFRNPFRITSDRLTGEMYIGEVGSFYNDEIDVLVKGGNYGWPVYEGTTLIENCSLDTLNTLGAYIPPLSALPRATINSVIGGYVYRGSALSSLNGKYICADYGNGDEVFSIDITTGNLEQIALYQGSGKVISFGQRLNGELYVLRSQFGNLYKIQAIGGQTVNQATPALISQTGAFSNLSTLEPVSGLIPYEMVESFWSDGTLKKRWIALPNDGVTVKADEQIKYSESGIWDFPIGTVVIKHFDLPISEVNPALTRKLETRFSIKNTDGSFNFVTYKWRDDGSDADLIEVGRDSLFEIETVSGTRQQLYHFPGSSECFSCHHGGTGGTIGPRTRNLNRLYTYPSSGKEGNQLVTLSSLGFLDEDIDYPTANDLEQLSAKEDLTASLEDRARSYLDVNCGYCHRPDNENMANFDARFTTPLEFSNLFSQDLNESIGLSEEWIIYPGDTSKSVLYQRLKSLTTGIAMPPISKNVIDQEGVDLIGEWIMSLNPGITTCDPINFAVGKTATQSSTATNPASLANDGNTNGGDGEISKTNSELEPWWEVDLGQVYNLKNLVLWNSSNCCTDDLNDFHVFVSDQPFVATSIAGTMGQSGVLDRYFPGTAQIENFIDINRTGRYIRIQKEGTGVLALAEVQIFGCLPKAFSQGIVGEVGQQMVGASSARVNFQYEYENPVVVAGPTGTTNTDPSPIRIRNISSTGFDIFIPEWECYDGTLNLESIPYIVMESGVFTLDNGQVIMAGNIDNVTSNWTTIPFPATFSNTPLVFTQCISTTYPDEVMVRTDPAQTNSSQTAVKLVEAESSDGIHQDEKLSWIAVESGSNSNAPMYEFGTTGSIIDNTFDLINFNQSYTNSSPVFIANIGSYNSSDPGILKHQTGTLTQSRIRLYIQEENCDDSETSVTDEDVNYMVFDQAGGISGTPAAIGNSDLGIFSGQQDVSTVGFTGSSYYMNGYYFQTGSGFGIEAKADRFQYMFRDHSGDGEIIARVLSLDNVHPNAKAGIMFRSTLSSNSKMIALVQHPDNGVSFEWRPVKNTTTVDTIATLEAGTTEPKFLKLIRSGDIFRAYYATESIDGPWTQIGPKVEVPMVPDIRVGLMTTSRIQSIPTHSVFDNVSVRETEVFWANQIGAKIHLQGPWDAVSQEMSVALNQSSQLPLEQPYSSFPWNYNGWECVETMPGDVVDWVLVEIRDPSDRNNILKRKACLLRNDGVIVDVFGEEGIDFGLSNYEAAYVCVIHRNHHGVMTNSTVDFD